MPPCGAPHALCNIYPVKCEAYFSGAKSIPPGFTPLNSEGQFTKLNSRSEERSVFNKGEAYLAGVGPADRTGV